MRVVSRLAYAIVASAMVISFSISAQAQITSVGQSASSSSASAGAAALGGDAGLNFAPSTTVHNPRNTPSMGLGSFGQGANPCAEGWGMNVGASGFGIGANNASTNPACLRLQAARAILAAGEAKGSQHAHAVTLIGCQTDPTALEMCRAAGLYYSYAPAQPQYAAHYQYAPQPSVQASYSQQSYYGTHYGQAAYSYAAVAAPQPQQMVQVWAPAYAPASTLVPGWCYHLGAVERRAYWRDCGG